MDFMSDSPVDLGSIVSQQYGQVLLQWLDEQVNVGDGTTEPEGVMNASGTTAISASNGNTGPPLVGDYEGLLFGINKPFKQGFATNRITFGGTEQSYQRSRSIAVGSTDERRVFGMDHESYTLLNHPYGIGEFFANTQLNFVNWGRYRMYRRLGLGIKVTTEGQTLVRGNLMMISARARYGGQIETGSAAAVTTNSQS
jgi:HK97 family phage major capsid protein